jgi:hypothetical protein
MTAEAAPATGDLFTAPAIPVPALPALPEMTPGYGYPGYAYPGYPGSYAGYSCGAPVVHYYVYPPAYSMPFSVPLTPELPAAPFFIYNYGVNPEFYPYAPKGQIEGDVIFYRALPAVPGMPIPTFEAPFDPAPGMAMPQAEEQESHGAAVVDEWF